MSTSRLGIQRPGRLAVLAAAALVLAVAALVPAIASAGAGAPARVPPRATGTAAGVIKTVAGGVGGPARATKVGLPSACGVSSAAGYIYVADGSAVRRVSVHKDWLETPAGDGATAPFSEGRMANRAGLSHACGVAADQSRNLVIADAQHERIRVLARTTGTFYGQAMTARHIYTVAGTAAHGFSGDGGPATQARLDDPTAVAVDGAGNLVIADTGNQRIRVVAATNGTFYGQAMTAGDIYTVAGGGNVIGDGVPATSAELNLPSGVAVDGAGNLVIADTGNQRVRVVAASTATFYGQAMTAGDIYTVAGTGTPGFSGDGGPATGADLSGPSAVTVDGSGNLVIADTQNQRVRVVAASTATFYGQAMTAGDIYTVAGTGTPGFSGDGAPATSAELSSPSGVAIDTPGNLVIADSGNNRIRVVAAQSGTFYGRPMTAGDIYTVAGNGNMMFAGDNGRALNAELGDPGGVAVDAPGNLVIADSGNNRIRVVAAQSGTFYGRAMTARDIYTVGGNGTEGFAGDGGLATSAELSGPGGVAVDGPGNLVIADTGNQRIRVVAGSTATFYGQAMTVGHIYTVAGDGTQGFAGDGAPATGAELSGPAAVAVDGSGNLVIADAGNQRVRVVAATNGTFYGQAMTAGDIYTVAGDGTQGFAGDGAPATGAELNFPYGVAVDGAGNLVIADRGNKRVRVVAASTATFYGQAMTAGDIYTVAGTGTGGFSGDGGPATSADLSGPSAVTVDGSGNLVIADTSDSSAAGNDRVRVVAASTGLFYGQAMTAGDIYTVAGNGLNGFYGDNDRATRARLYFPSGVAVDGSGDLLIADTFNNRIREVTG
jgi:hypothetical protein